MAYFIWFLSQLFGVILKPFCKKRTRFGQMLAIGYSGAENTGSEARTLVAMEQWLKSGASKIILPSLDPEKTQKYLAAMPNVVVVPLHSFFIASIPKYVLSSEAVVLVEGSCFMDNFSPIILWFFMFSAALAKKLGKKVLAYAVDAGKTSKSNTWLIKKVATTMDLVSVRSKGAALALEQKGVNGALVSTDTAWLFKPAAKDALAASTKINFDEPTIAVAYEELFWWPVVPRPIHAIAHMNDPLKYKWVYYHTWDDERAKKSDKVLSAVADAARQVSSKLGAKTIVIAMERLDLEPCKKLSGILDNAPIFSPPDYNARLMAKVLTSLKFLITCRYHAFILASLVGVPTVAIAHDQRLRDVFAEAGLAEFCVSHDDPQIDLSLAKAINAALSKQETIIDSIAKYRGHCQKLASELPLHFAKNMWRSPNMASQS